MKNDLSFLEATVVTLLMLSIFFLGYNIFLPHGYLSNLRDIVRAKEMVERDIRMTQKMAVESAGFYSMAFFIAPVNTYYILPNLINAIKVNETDLKPVMRVNFADFGIENVDISKAFFNGLPYLAFDASGVPKDSYGHRLLIDGEITLMAGNLARRIIIPADSPPFEVIPRYHSKAGIDG